MSLFSIYEMSSSALAAQSQRLNVSASNMANSDSVTGPDSEPYHAKQVVFSVSKFSANGIGGVSVAEVVDDPSPFRLEYQPSHPLADERGYIRKPSVDVMEEMINTISASRSYQANIEVMNTTKSLIQKILTLDQ